MHHELWLTALFNKFFSAPASALLSLVGIEHDPHKPWSNYMSVEIFAILLLMIVALVVRSRLSVDKPGKLQLTFEAIYGFLNEQAHDIIGHGHKKHVAMFFTFFVSILTFNLIGIIPTFEAPTMYYFVPAGIALVSFCYFNGQGLLAIGPVATFKHMAGPVWWLWWFMFPLELISYCIRPVSLTIRLYANMYAGEEVTVNFMKVVELVIPVALMGLHVFVSFLQAFIFTVLSIAYVGGAVAHEEH